MCGKKLSGLGSLKKHIKFKHGDNIIKCNMCDSTSKSHDQLQRHIETRHENMKYSCNSCTYLTTFLNELREHHKESNHSGMKYQCKQCDYRATVHGNLKIHRQAMHEGLVYKCDLCEYNASTPRSVGWHKQAKHKWNWTRLFLTILKLLTDICEKWTMWNFIVPDHWINVLQENKINVFIWDDVYILSKLCWRWW